MVDGYRDLEDVVRHSFASVVWSHKIQEKQADIYSDRFKFLENVKIVVSAIASAGILTLIFTDPFWLKISTAILSIISTAIYAYGRSFNMQELILSHKTAANKLWNARERYKILLTEIRWQSKSVECLFDEYKNLSNDVGLIYQEAPNTTDKAVQKAKEALEIKKDNTFEDGEIDSFLPHFLKLS